MLTNNRKKALIVRVSVFTLTILLLFSLSNPICIAQQSDTFVLVPTEETDPLLVNEYWLDSINAKKLWNTWNDNGIVPGQGIVVAVLDTGIDVSHSDLKNSLWVNQAEVNGETGVDDDNNGYVDDINGVNLVNSFTRMTDSYGHGTQMSGIIGMTGNDGGGAGVAYGCKILPVKCSIDGGFSIETVVEGLEYAVEQKADVICMSFGTYTDSPVLRNAIKEASEHCVIVAAAGNESRVIPGKNTVENNSGIVYPAAYEEVIGVMAGDGASLASFTNWDSCPGDGTDYDIVAPGSVIYTTTRNGKYTVTSGTSGAAAMVSASVATFYNIYEGKTKPSPKVIKGLFLDSMKHNIAVSKDELHISYPCLDLADIVDKALSEKAVTDTEPPIISNKTKESAIAGEPITFTACVQDNVGVKKVICHYCLPNGTWKETVMEPQSNDEYKAVVANNNYGECAYYFTAYDETNQTLCGNTSKPLSMLIYIADINNLIIDKLPAQIYTGTAITPEVVLWNGKAQLCKDIDYTISYDNNTDIGTAYINIEGKGYYTGKTFTYFYIEQQKQNKPTATTTPCAAETTAIPPAATTIPTPEILATATPAISTTSTPSPINPAPTSPAPATSAPTTSATVTSAPATLAPVTLAPVTLAPATSPTVTTVPASRCAVPAIKSITRCKQLKNHRLSIKWTKKKGIVTGFQISITKKKTKYKNNRTITTRKSHAIISHNPQKGQKYYIHIRAYRTINSKTYYGKWLTRRFCINNPSQL